MDAVVTPVVIGMAVVAGACDLRTRHVPNVLTFGAAGAAFAVAIVRAGGGGLGTSLLGWLVGLGLFFPFFALGGMGAGDVKLLAAFGAWLGPAGVLWAAIWASLAGGLLAIVVGAWRGYLSEAVRNTGAILALWRTVGLTRLSAVTLDESRGPRLAYAVPIGIGAVLVTWLGSR